jgi:hypothetical protein
MLFHDSSLRSPVSCSRTAHSRCATTRERCTTVLPEYSYDWPAAGQAGRHTIAARLVVRDEGEMWDSVRVVVDTTHGFAGGHGVR